MEVNGKYEKIEKKRGRTSYRYVYQPWHPRARKTGYVGEHWMMVDWKWWRDEGVALVHHKDGNGLNNDPENLQPLSFYDHVKVHMGELAARNWLRAIRWHLDRHDYPYGQDLDW